MSFFNKRGVTLVEFVVAMAILGVVLSVIYSVFSSSVRTADQIQASSLLQEEVRALSEVINRDVRMAGSFPNGAIVACLDYIQQATDSSFEIYMDVNGDGDCYDAGEDISYSFDSGILMRKNSNTDSGQVILGDYVGIDCFRFYYLDVDGNVISDPNSNRDSIVSICVQAVIRAPWEVMGFSNNGKNYVLCGPFSDHYPRKFINFCSTIRNRIIGRE